MTENETDTTEREHSAYARHIGSTHARDMMTHTDPIVGAAVSVEAGQAVARAVEGGPK